MIHLLASCRLLRNVVGAVLGAFKPLVHGSVRLSAAEVDLHAAALNELHPHNAALQVLTFRGPLSHC